MGMALVASFLAFLVTNMLVLNTDGILLAKVGA